MNLQEHDKAFEVGEKLGNRFSACLAIAAFFFMFIADSLVDLIL